MCPKIVVFSKDKQSVLLAKRENEKDLNGVFTFIGGKMEQTDGSILSGLKREKTEEVGVDFKINLNTKYSVNMYYEKKDGSKMILPHHYAYALGGDIRLSPEYAEYRWVPIVELDAFEPKVKTITQSVREMQALMKIEAPEDMVEI